MPKWPDWLGITEKRWTKQPDEEVRPPKTLWDLVQLAVIPIVLAAIALAFNSSESARERRREDLQAQRERVASLAARRDDALQAYLGQMSQLLLDHNLLRSLPASSVRASARALTLTVLRRLDGERKGQVVQFLYDANLLLRPISPAERRATAVFGGGQPTKRFPPLSLDRADLSAVGLSGVTLDGADLTGTNLRNANFSNASLLGASLDRTRLEEAEFSGASLGNATLRDSCISGAHFSNASIDFVSFQGSQGAHVDFRGSTLFGAVNMFQGAVIEDSWLLPVNTLVNVSRGEAPKVRVDDRNRTLVYPKQWGPRGATDLTLDELCKPSRDFPLLPGR